MNKGTLPPQAYTREVLTAAYNWMQSQPESIKKLADSSESLVGLYLRAKRSGDQSLETAAPVSQESFRANLKNLAAELEQFSTSPSTATFSPTVSPLATSTKAPVPNGGLVFAAPSTTPTVTTTSTSRPISSAPTTSEVIRPPVQPKSQPLEKQEMPNTEVAWDESTSNAISHTRRLLNLSSDQEAIRALIALGFDRISKI